MAIKNTLLGGTDWIDGAILYSEDLNDTFDKVAEDHTDLTTDLSEQVIGKTAKRVIKGKLKWEYSKQ